MSIFLKLADQSFCDEHVVRGAAYPNSLPEVLRDEDLEEYGFAKMDEGEKPILKPWQAMTHQLIKDGSQYKLVYSAVGAESAAQIRAATITSKRYDIETGGISISGTDIPTDRDTQQVFTAMYLRAMNDPNYTINFKTKNGFVVLSSAEIIALSNAVHDHVQNAFNREAQLLQLLASGEPVSGEDW